MNLMNLMSYQVSSFSGAIIVVMNLIENLLTTLGEEGSEVSQQVAKCLCFGLDDVYTTIHEDGTQTKHSVPTNRYRLVEELNDFKAMVELLVEYEILPTDWEREEWKAWKKKKVLRYISYASEIGALKP